MILHEHRAILVLALVACVGGLPFAADDDTAAALQQQQQALRAQVARLAGAGDTEHAAELLRQMAALDREHPKLYKATLEFFRPTRKYAAAGEQIQAYGSQGPGLAYGRGLVELYQYHNDAAELHLLQALELYVAVDHIAGQAAAHGALGYIDLKAERLDEARERFQSSAALAGRLRDHSAQAENLHSMALIEVELGRHDQALTLLERKLEICRQVDDRCVAGTWQSVAMVHVNRGDYPSAIEAAESAQTLQGQEGALVDQVSTLQDLGSYYSLANRPDVAVERLQQAVDVAGSVGEASRVAGAQYRLGAALLAVGDTRRSLEVLRPAAATLAPLAGRRAGLRTDAMRAMRSLGQALARTGEFAAAERALRDALDLAVAGNSRDVEAACSLLLADVLWARGQQSAAFVAATRALQLYSELKDPSGRLQALNNLGTYAWRLGQFDVARQHYESCLELAIKGGDEPGRALAMGNLSVVAETGGDPVAALKLGRGALAIQSSLGDAVATAFARTTLVRPLLAVGQEKAAQKELGRALAAFRAADHPEGEALALVLRAFAERQSGKLTAAMRSYRSAQALAQRFGLERRQVEALTGQARALEQLGRVEEALVTNLRAMDLLESLRERLVGADLALRFLPSRYDLYERALEQDLALKAVAGGAHASAFRISERARARGVSDLLAESRASMRSGLPADLVSREARLTDERNVAAANLTAATGREQAARRLELQAAEARLRSFRIQLRIDSPQYALMVHPEPVSIEELQALLAPDETILNYHLGHEQAYAWIVSRSEATFHRLGPTSRIRELTAAALSRIAGGSLSLGRQVPGATELAALAEILLPRPLEPGRRLLVVPDGPLHHFPFDTLRVDGRFVVEDHETRVLPSATALRIMRAHPAAISTGGFFGIGDPSGADARFPALPDSRKALQAIGGRFGESGRKLLMGEAATRSMLQKSKLEQYRYLHFATHGWLDSRDPRLCGLKLTPESSGDGAGFLYLDDILSLRLKAQLVVLASCRSGLGEALDGEGLVSLSRAFFYAGARSLVVTLWDVEDHSTAEFMQAFYASLEDGLSVSAALRRTKLLFLRSERPAWRRPANWSPFVLLGEPGPGTALQ